MIPMLRIDVREIYLKRLITLDRYTHASFKTALNLMLLFLQKNPADVDEALAAVDTFLYKFRNEKGVPSLDYVLYELDKMRTSGKTVMRIKSRYKRTKYTYQEVTGWLADLEDYILDLVRAKADTIRITNPEMAVV